MSDTVAQQFIAGLEDLASFYRANPDFPLPYQVRSAGRLTIDIIDSGSAFSDLVSQLGGNRRKALGASCVYVARDFGPVALQIVALRDEVCERVQVGTRTVERPVYPDGNGGTTFDLPDPVGTETVTEPIYEWECRPILDDGRQDEINRAGIDTARAALDPSVRARLADVEVDV